MGGRGSSDPCKLTGKQSFDKTNQQYKDADGNDINALRQNYRNSWDKVSGGTKKDYKFLEDYAKDNGWRITNKRPPNVSDTAHGSTNFNSKSIFINSNLTQAQQIRTLAHEIGHAKLHGKGEMLTIAQREIQAEGFSRMVTNRLGIDDPSSGYYMQGWRQRDGGITPSNFFDYSQNDLINLFNDLFGSDDDCL